MSFILLHPEATGQISLYINQTGLMNQIKMDAIGLPALWLGV